MFTKRNIKPKLLKALSTTPVVFLEGARQTGKTTLIREVGREKNYSFTTFDDYTELALAKSDPPGYLSQIQKPTILDEVQRIPEIFLPIKKDVDENRNPGRFALTGSANPLLIPRLGDSLAGRIEIIPLYPFSQGELIGRKEIFVDSVFAENFDLSSHPIDRDKLWHRIIVGGYPEMQVRENDSERRNAWCKSYITMILERDVQDLSRIEGLRLFPNLLKLIAARTASLLNIAELSRSIAISTSTLQRYLTLLRALFFIHLQPPWLTNHGKRLTKSSKIYMLDSGLLSFLLGLDQSGMASQPHLAGSVLESFVVAEILKQISWSSLLVQSFHFRSDPHEVDLVLEDSRGRIVGIEIKSAGSVHPSDFKGLHVLKETAKDRFLRGIILYMGERTVPMGGHFFALPISALWEHSHSQN